MLTPKSAEMTKRIDFEDDYEDFAEEDHFVRRSRRNRKYIYESLT